MEILNNMKIKVSLRTYFNLITIMEFTTVQTASTILVFLLQKIHLNYGTYDNITDFSAAL